MKNIIRGININIDKVNYSPVATFKQEDSGVLSLELFKNGVPFDITGQTVKLGAYRPNGTVVEQIDGFNINNNTLTINFKNNIFAIAGIVELDIELIDTAGEMTTSSFYIKVNKKVLGDNNINASNELDTITHIVNEFNDGAMKALDEWNNLKKIAIDENNAANLQNQVNGLDSQLAEIAILDNDTKTIQQMIDLASKTTHYIKLKPKVYKVGCISPKSNVTIDLNGATLKLKDNTDLPLFYDYGEGGIDDFSVINGVIDLNKTYNNKVNQSAGFMWLTNCNDLSFSNLKITNAFRNIFNFYTCNNVKLKDIECTNCGLENLNGFYTYGASFENNCNNIEINNFIMKKIYGYGIHIRQSNQVKISNIDFNDFYRKGYSIGITLTKAKNVEILNYNQVKGDYIGIECNHSENINLNNINIDNVVTPFVFGDNGSGEFNKFIKINNLITSNTTGVISMNLNYLENLVIENFKLDKNFSTSYNTNSNNIFLKSGVISSNMTSVNNYKRFYYSDVSFNGVTLNKYNEKTKNDLTINSFKLLNDETKSINFRNILGVEYFIFGKMLVHSSFSNNNAQATVSEYNINIYPNSLYISEIGSFDGSYGRKVNITVDGGDLIFTNNTGVTLSINIKMY